MNEEQRRLLLKEFDEEYFRQGFTLAGLDEAGRGPLAGPVVVAAVMLERQSQIPYVYDSKKVSPKRRQQVYEAIKKEAICIGVGVVEPEEIDRINILQATYVAAQKAVKALSPKPDLLLNDALIVPKITLSQEKIVKGDAKSYHIAAASIIAKVTRDRMMEEYDQKYPGYGFKNHKGYGTKAHYEAIRKLGKCPIHRESFLKKLH